MAFLRKGAEWTPGVEFKYCRKSEDVAQQLTRPALYYVFRRIVLQKESDVVVLVSWNISPESRRMQAGAHVCTIRRPVKNMS